MKTKICSCGAELNTENTRLHKFEEDWKRTGRFMVWFTHITGCKTTGIIDDLDRTDDWVTAAAIAEIKQIA